MHEPLPGCAGQGPVEALLWLWEPPCICVRTHPDWGNKATFCLLSGANAGHNFFGYGNIEGQQAKWRFPKVRWLAAQGFELCNHTLWHATLSKYSDAVVQEQIARGQLAIDSAVPDNHVVTFCLPLGAGPKNRPLA